MLITHPPEATVKQGDVLADADVVLSVQPLTVAANGNLEKRCDHNFIFYLQ